MGAEMAHGVSPGKMPSPHHNTQENPHCVWLQATRTHSRTCGLSKIPGCHHDQGLSMEYPYKQHHHESEPHSVLSAEECASKLPTHQDSSLPDTCETSAWIRPHCVGSSYPGEHKEDGNAPEACPRYTLYRYHNTSSVTAMLDHLNWTTLEQRRQQQRLSMYFKIHHQLVAVDKNKYLTPLNRTSRHTHKEAYQIPDSSKNYLANSFFCRTTREWNALPAQTVEAPSLESFQARLARGAPQRKSV